jgi:F0F1-type ATP synthase assembly protein I
MRTQDDFFGRSKHVQAQCDLILVTYSGEECVFVLAGHVLLCVVSWRSGRIRAVSGKLIALVPFWVLHLCLFRYCTCAFFGIPLGRTNYVNK